MRLRIVSCRAVLGAACCLTATLPAALPERKIFQFGEYTIEASAGDEACVEALALRLADFQLPPPPAPPALKLSLDDLDKRRDHLLGRMAAYLGLAQPTGLMVSAYEAALKSRRLVVLRAPTAVPRRFAVWRQPELAARIGAAEKIPGFRRTAAGGLEFVLERERAAGPSADATAQIAGAWHDMVWPVRISGGGRTPDEEAAEALRQLRDFYGKWTTAALADASAGNVFGVLRETVESGVVWQYLTSKDRRWFCDGVANYVAYKVVEGELGAGNARGYYDLSAQLGSVANNAQPAALAAWPAAEDADAAKYPPELSRANDALATKVIADLCARHGDDLLPKLFKEIGKTRREKATIDTVYRACKKLTGENLRLALVKPGG